MVKWLFVVLFGVTLSSTVLAFSPSAEQLQIFQSLSAEEKRSLLKQYAPNTQNTQQQIEKEVDTVTRLEVPVRKETGMMTLDSTDVNTQSSNGVLDNHSQLEPFGKFLFAGQPTTFAPVNSIPVPTDYVLGAGDQLKIQLFGSKNESYDLVVDRNGQISLPNIGPISLAGITFSEAKVLLIEKLQALGVGVNSSITMGELRSFRIFVLGESRTPGSYLVSGMATITHALYVSGGLTDIASYRNIQLKRRGKLIKSLDLYDLLLKGDTSSDIRLQPGDSVFIPRLTQQVAVDGQVLKPALYELKNESRLKQVIKLAGGLASDAYTKSIELSRINSPETRDLLSVDLTKKSGKNYRLKNGDRINVPKVTASMNDLVLISGEVAKEGVAAISESTRLLDLLPSRRQFTNNADLSTLLIKRQESIADNYTILQADWVQAYKTPSAEDNLLLQPRDQLIVLSLKDGEQRRLEIDDLLSVLKSQETLNSPLKSIAINGPVKFAGAYPLIEGMKISDLLAMSGGMLPSAMFKEAELIRYSVINGEKRQVRTQIVNLEQLLAGEEKHNLELKPYDSLTIKQVTDWSDASSVVKITGEVSYPGAYVIKPGDTLESVLIRAGGFTEWSAPQNTIFTRKALKIREKNEMNAMADELEKSLLFSLKSTASQDVDAQAMAALGHSLVEKVKQTEALGRLVIGLNPKELTKYQASLQLELRDGDELVVPKRSNEVVIMGEVSRAASILYQPDMTLEDYLKQAGGLTKRADTSAIYIVHGDGSIEPYETTFFMASNQTIQPGDAIVVPMDVERVSPVITWTAVTKILSNLAVTAATLQTLGVIN